MNQDRRAEAEELWAWISGRLDLAKSDGNAHADPVERLPAWVRGWAADHDLHVDAATPMAFEQGKAM